MSNIVPAVAVMGPSGSGKSTFARRIRGGYVLEMDEYFRDYGHPEYYTSPEWDTPRAYDMALLADHIGRLLKGEKVRLAHFNFNTGCREEGLEILLEGYEALVVEGLYAFLIAAPFDHRVFIDCTFGQMVERCLPRDQDERGRTDLKKILGMYDASWRKYAAELFPARKDADLVMGHDWAKRLPAALSLEDLKRLEDVAL